MSVFICVLYVMYVFSYLWSSCFMYVVLFISLCLELFS